MGHSQRNGAATWKGKSQTSSWKGGIRMVALRVTRARKKTSRVRKE
jgi:hypothetical protein